MPFLANKSQQNGVQASKIMKLHNKLQTVDALGCKARAMWKQVVGKYNAG